MIDNRTPEPPGLVGLLTELDGLGISPVRHGDFLGLQGPGLHRLPARTWRALSAHESALRRLLRDTPAPFRRRRQWHR